MKLPRRPNTSAEGPDFGRQMFQFASDTFDFLRGLVTRVEALENAPAAEDDGIADALQSATTVVDVSAATAPTAGQVLTAVDDETATWQTPSAAGTVESELFTAPASAHALDDEFTGTSFDAKWTLRNAAGTTVSPSATTVDPYTTFASGDPKVQVGRTGWSSWLQVQVESNNTNWTMCQPYAVPSDMFIWCRHAVQRQVTINNNAGFCVISFFGDDGSGNPDLLGDQVYLGYNPNAADPQLEWGRYVGGVSTASQFSTDMGFAQGATFEYYAIQKIGTTYHGWAFGQGRAVAYLGSQTHAGTMAFVGFQFTDATVVAPGNTLISLDFFRAVDAASYLP